MKKILIAIVCMVSGLLVTAQNSSKDVFSKNEIVWYGLDFSKAKMIGQFDQVPGSGPANGSELKAKYVQSWNLVIVNEAKKYDLKRFFRKDNVYNDLNPVQESNSKIDPDNFTSINSYKFTDANTAIQEVVNKYPKGDKADGIGVVFIIESFNKSEQIAILYVTFFDIASKKILYKEQMSGKPGGFGLRNYWVGAIMDILKQIDSNQYKYWKMKYGN